jgi:hypothetical protein
MKTPIFGDVTPCIPLSDNEFSVEHAYFIFRVEEQDRKETSTKEIAMFCLFFGPEVGGDMFLRKVG